MTVASDLYFLDSNIWLYALLKKVQLTPDDLTKAQVSNRLIDSPNVAVSTQVINEVSVNLIKKARFTESQIQSLIQSFYDGCQVIAPSQSLLIQASQVRDRYSLSFWDGLIIAAALTANVGTLYSEDMQNGLVVFDQLAIVNPFS
ncbi:PIN domain-containing protein [Halomicronema sp. CCY15110]|uniref:PIN domain-containing protein n=1 Tax=Halomicronema sp. CCY15110 TaxID=2767773 RepID=UPI00194E62FC|nr:PIN domain-containing protein [Halomicronema sp. CCY15110]